MIPMIIALYAFLLSAALGSRLCDIWSTIACEYSDDPGINFLAGLFEDLHAEIAGLACIYLVA
jgi:hypothetical protein